MMITIAAVADRIGEYIGKQAELPSEVKHLCYGVECLLVLLLNMGIILALGWICGAFKETALITLSALFMKHIIGGPHLSGFLRCTGFSALVLVGSAWLLKIYGSPSYWWLMILAIMGICSILLCGLMLGPEFKFSKKQLRSRKILGVLVLTLLACLNIWRRDLWLTATLIGVLLTVMLRTPIGVLIVQWVEQITKRKEA
jgi:accessory gene regulator protein AgrB